MAAIDVTDATFEAEVLDRSMEVPVVVDLWASWCGPCKTLGPIIEKVVDDTDGRVVLAKIDVDANPYSAQTFRVQSIPAVYAVYQRKVVDGFIGALPEPQVRQFVARVAPEPTEVDRLVAAGDEASLRRAVELEPANATAITALAALLVEAGQHTEALALLDRIPETAEVRHLRAEARVGGEAVVADDGVDAKLDALLARVKGDDEARQEFVDLLEVLGPDDPRTAQYRKALTRALY